MVFRVEACAGAPRSYLGTLSTTMVMARDVPQPAFKPDKEGGLQNPMWTPSYLVAPTLSLVVRRLEYGALNWARSRRRSAAKTSL